MTDRVMAILDKIETRSKEIDKQMEIMLVNLESIENEKVFEKAEAYADALAKHANDLREINKKLEIIP